MDYGSTCAQLFVGTKTLVTDVYGMMTDKKLVNTLEDNIRKRGAMDKIISNSVQSDIFNRVKDILRSLFIDDWKSEPCYQHQTSLKENIRLQRGRPTLSSIEQARLHARYYLP